MTGEEVKMIMEMKGDIGSIKATLETMQNTNSMAAEALQSSRSAHKRLDSIDRIIFWAATTVIGCLIVGAIALLYQNKGGS